MFGSKNPNAMDLIKKYKDKLYIGDWDYVLENETAFEIDKEAMKKQIQPFAEELLSVVLHPDRVIRILNEYNYNIVSDEYWDDKKKDFFQLM